MSKTVLALALSLVGLTATAQPGPGSNWELQALGDGSAKLSVQTDSLPGVLRVQAHFLVGLPVNNSEEAHAKNRGFAGELRIDGKPCADAHGRLTPADGRATGEAMTSCSIGVPGDRPISVEAVVTRADGLGREDVRVHVTATKTVRP